MRRLILLAWLFVLVLASVADAAEFKIGERTILVPDGFEIELAAGPPLVERPISIARDEQGRLYVTDSAGMSDRADKQLELKPHRIFRLEDSDGDGCYDKSLLFADRMMFPEGAMWHAGSLYVAAPPQIWKLTDADGDGRAEQREVWFDGQTLTGCANDLHGPYLGRDGFFYWCKGAFAEQKYTLPNGRPLVTRASHTFRARPDATGIEPVLTGGMDNPVGVAFLSSGERILSCTFFQHPEAGRRDGLIHAIYGGVYGKRHDPIYAHAMTGDVMPVLSHQGAAAPCGLIAGGESLFGGGFTDNAFACYFNLHKVVQHELIAEGATYQSRETDFFFCDHPDFHPTDVFEDADGSLLVVDTGGWYKVCCPTSQLAKPDVLGAIYRIRRTGAAKVADPLGEQIAWDKLRPAELALLLADSREFVRRRATKLLREAGDAAVPALHFALSLQRQPAVRLRAIWTLAGIDSPAARDAIRAKLTDADRGVVQAAAHAAGLWRDRAALGPLLKIIARAEPATNNASVVRAAPEALGRLGDPRAVSALLQAIGQLPATEPDAAGAPADVPQRVLEHSLTYALIEINDPAATAAGLASPHPAVRRASLVALDQMPDGGLQSNQVIPLLDHTDPTLHRTAQWIVSHRSAWGADLVGYLRQRLVHTPASDRERKQLAVQLAQLAKSPAIQDLLAAALREEASPAARRIVLAAMAQSGLTATPPAWLDALAAVLPGLAGPAGELVLAQTVATARALPMPKAGHSALRSALLEIGRREMLPIDVRLQALTVVVGLGGVGEISPGLFAELTARILPEESFDNRSAAAAVLATASLTGEQRAALLETAKQVGPLELPRLLPALERDTSEAFGLKAVAMLSSSIGLRGLRADQVKPFLEKYPQPVRDAGQSLLAQLNTSAAEQATQLDRLLAELPAGDLRRGHEVFLSKKAACAACHAVGYLGGRLGPDLTNISKVRTDRDLIEAIVFPSASFVRSYEPVLVELDDGRVASGIVIRETADELVLATAPTQTQPIPRREIVEIQPAPVSMMPQGYATVLSRQELADLLAYLKNAPR